MVGERRTFKYLLVAKSQSMTGIDLTETKFLGCNTGERVRAKKHRALELQFSPFHIKGNGDFPCLSKLIAIIDTFKLDPDLEP